MPCWQQLYLHHREHGLPWLPPTAWQSTTTFGEVCQTTLLRGFRPPCARRATTRFFGSDGKFDTLRRGSRSKVHILLPPRTAVTGAIGRCQCVYRLHLAATTPQVTRHGLLRLPPVLLHERAELWRQCSESRCRRHTDSMPWLCHTTYVATAWLGAVFNHTTSGFRTTARSASDCTRSRPTTRCSRVINCHTQAQCATGRHAAPRGEWLRLRRDDFVQLS